jgi:hypothetical protein
LDDGAREGNLDLEALIDSVLDFARPSVRDAGQTALNLVDEAADVFRRMEDHARETEEKLRLAEMRAEAQHELVIETERMLQDASRALAQAQSRIEAQEDRLIAAEFRARGAKVEARNAMLRVQAAEVEARDAKQALALVEEAIRRHLLCTNLTADAGKLEPVSEARKNEAGDAPPASSLITTNRDDQNEPQLVRFQIAPN